MQQQSHYKAIKFICQYNILGFSDFFYNFFLNNIKYRAGSIIKIGDIQLNNTLNSNLTTITMYKCDDIIKYSNLYTVEIFLLKVHNNDIKSVLIKTGRIAELQIEDNKITLEVDSVFNILNNKINNSYSNKCRACFGDRKCNLNREDYLIKNVTIKNIISSHLIEIDISSMILPKKLQNIQLNMLNELIENGFIYDDNNIQIAKIISFNNDRLTIQKLLLNLEFNIKNTINIQCMCNKSFIQCTQEFKNNKHFRGELVFKK